MDREFFTIDFETTGVDAKTCHPVEVAVYGNHGPVLEALIKPPCPIPPETSAVHHISDADVEDALDWDTYKKDLTDICEGEPLKVLVAHNAQYEKDVLGEFTPVLWVCTYKAALRIWPEAPSHKNEVLRYYLSLGDDRGRNSNQRPHSAMHDARVTHLLFLECLNHATLEEMIEWTEQPAKLPKMPMGKHFGAKWEDVPTGYLVWCCQQADMREDVKFCAKTELDRRGGRK